MIMKMTTEKKAFESFAANDNTGGKKKNQTISAEIKVLAIPAFSPPTRALKNTAG